MSANKNLSIYISVSRNQIYSPQYYQMLKLANCLRKKYNCQIVRTDFRIKNDKLLKMSVNQKTKKAIIVLVVCQYNIIDEIQFVEVATAKMNNIYTLAFDSIQKTFKPVENFKKKLNNINNNEYGEITLGDNKVDFKKSINHIIKSYGK